MENRETEPCSNPISQPPIFERSPREHAGAIFATPGNVGSKVICHSHQSLVKVDQNLLRVSFIRREPYADLVDCILQREEPGTDGAIHAIPVKAEHAQSLNSRRLFDACILVTQIDFRRRDRAEVERIKNDRISPVFEVRITDLASIPGKNYQRLYAELDTLFEMVLRWNIVGEDANVEWDMKSHFLSSLGYGKGQKRGLIRFSMDPAILGIVLEPSNWATLSLQAMERLGTAASYRDCSSSSFRSQARGSGSR